MYGGERRKCDPGPIAGAAVIVADYVPERIPHSGRVGQSAEELSVELEERDGPEGQNDPPEKESRPGTELRCHRFAEAAPGQDGRVVSAVIEEEPEQERGDPELGGGDDWRGLKQGFKKQEVKSQACVQRRGFHSGFDTEELPKFPLAWHTEVSALERE